MDNFYCLEGIDGCGKSTQISMLIEKLTQKGYECLRIREPGGTKISEKIREILLSPESSDLSDFSELLLYNAARAQLIHEIIKPALEQGKIVLADRFAWSTLAYQGYGRGLNIKSLQQLSDLTCGEYWPKQTFILNIPVEVFRSRSDKEQREPDRIEKEKSDFFEKVRQGYLSMAKDYSDMITIIDGQQSINEINAEILNAIVANME